MPDARSQWPSHAVLPFLDADSEKHFVYYGSRTKDNIAYSFRSEFDPKNERLLKGSNLPLLKPGEIGYFDQHGAISSSIVTIDNNIKYLYYIGWRKGHTPPLFYANIGLAISEDGGKTFKKISKVPIIPNDEKNPILMTSPHVIFKQGLFYMVYVSGVKWEEVDGMLQSYYRICSAESKDGIDWYNTGQVLIDFGKDETNFARPWILEYDNYYHMFFSKAGRKNKYRVGYASSEDLKTWVRDDSKVQIDVSRDSFDSEMICYPSVTLINKKLYMLYNGNKFGHDGIGMAVHAN